MNFFFGTGNKEAIKEENLKKKKLEGPGGFNVAVDGSTREPGQQKVPKNGESWTPQPAEDLSDFKDFYRELWSGHDDPFKRAQTERRVGDLGNLLTAFRAKGETVAEDDPLAAVENAEKSKRDPNLQEDEEEEDRKKTVALAEAQKSARVSQKSAQVSKKEQGAHEHAFAVYPLLSGKQVKENLKDSGKRDPSMIDQEKWHQVQLKTRVRETYDTKSPEVMVLLRGTKVRVVEKRKRRVRIDSPCKGWVSLFTNDGWLILAPAWTQRWNLLRQAHTVHDSVTMSSKRVAKLTKGETVHVVEFQGRRVRIDEPVIGWCSLMSKDGEILLEPTEPPKDLFLQHQVNSKHSGSEKPTPIDFSLRRGERWRLVGYYPRNRLHLKLIKERIPGYHPTKKVSLFDAFPYLARGSSMMKFGKRGKPHFRIVQLSPDSGYLLWFSANKYMDQSKIAINSVTSVMMGQHTENFKNMKWTSLSPCSFSVIYDKGTKTLDLVAKSSDEALLWVHALRKLVDMRKTYDFCQADPESDYPRRRNSERIKTLLVDVIVGDNFDVHHPGTMVEDETEETIKIRVKQKLRDIKETIDRIELVMSHPSLVKIAEIPTNGFKYSTQKFFDPCVQRWKDLKKQQSRSEGSEERLHKLECQLWRLEIDVYPLREKVEVMLRDLAKRYLPAIEEEKLKRQSNSAMSAI